MYEKDFRSWLKHFDFIILDLIAITVSFWVAFIWRNHINYGSAREITYRNFYLVFIALYIIIVFLFRSYSSILRRNCFEEIIAVFKQNILFFGFIFAYLVFTQQSILFSRLFLTYFIIQNILTMCIFRFLLKKLVRKKLLKSNKLARLVVFTNDKLAKNCIEELKSIEYQPFIVSGIVLIDKNKNGKYIEEIPIVADRDSMLEYVRLNVVDQVLFHVESFSDDIKNIMDQLLKMGVIVHVDLEQFDTLPNKMINKLGGLSVITTSFQTASVLEVMLKRCMDIVGATIGLFITGIVFVFVAPIIFIKSPGPVLFSQERIGKNGRKFKIYKFRSMYLDAEERKKELLKKNQMQGLMFKMDNDPRIIKGIGHFIRNTSIDELPQFWNILKGDMSLVGTRPPTVDEFEQYNYRHKIRLSFRPGLTGLWQVSGRSDITDFEEVVRLDENYIANWNLWLDIKIILKTVQVVLLRKGSK